MSSPLIAAAQALLTEATPGMVKQVLLLLLDTDTAPAPLRAASTPRAPRTPRTPPTPRTRPRREAKVEVTAKSRNLKRERAPDDADWEATRQRIRDAMQERGTTPADLAAAIGRAESTTRLNLYRRTPPTPAMLDALQSWLDGSASEVAATAPPFRRTRGHPAKPRTSNGDADTPTTAA